MAYVVDELTERGSGCRWTGGRDGDHDEKAVEALTVMRLPMTYEVST